MTSQESKELIKNHISICENCKRELEILKDSVVSEEETMELDSLLVVKKNIRWTSVWDNLMRNEISSVRIANANNKVDVVYYCENSDGNNVKVVYGEKPSGGVVILPRFVLANYFKISVLLTAILGVIWIVVRKRYKEMKYLFFVPFSYMLSAILLQNGFVSYSATFGVITNGIGAVVIYGICILGLSVCEQYMEDRKL